ncbi:MAG: agglutinin biogenesis protein MshK [Cognaticolwellia sp.]
MYKIIIAFLLSFLSQYASCQQVDPTMPFGAVASTSGNEKITVLVLQSIIKSDIKKAIIDGQILNVGDKYKGFELIEINSNGVVLNSAQGRMELSLFSGVIANSK